LLTKIFVFLKKIIFFFKDLGDLPDFELPDFLPDLPGIAQNLAFANDLEDLPDIPFFEEKSNVNQALPTPAVLHLSQPPLPTIEVIFLFYNLLYKFFIVFFIIRPSLVYKLCQLYPYFAQTLDLYLYRTRCRNKF
jgi:hypothetical protein